MKFLRKNEIKEKLGNVDGTKISHIIVLKNIFNNKYYFKYIYRNEDINIFLKKFTFPFKILEIYNTDFDILDNIEKYYEIENSNLKCNEALEYATKKHKGQMRKGSNPKEYITHPIMTAKLINYFKKDSNKLDDLICAAYLHDTLEDTTATCKEISNKFGNYVLWLVNGLTSDKNLQKELGKKKYLALKMNKMPSHVLDIKLCDRLANVIDLNNAEDEFKYKYIDETLYILKYISKNRQLTETQNRIKKVIIVEIKELLNTNKKTYRYHL